MQTTKNFSRGHHRDPRLDFVPISKTFNRFAGLSVRIPRSAPAGRVLKPRIRASLLAEREDEYLPKQNCLGPATGLPTSSSSSSAGRAPKRLHRDPGHVEKGLGLSERKARRPGQRNTGPQSTSSRSTLVSLCLPPSLPTSTPTSSPSSRRHCPRRPDPSYQEGEWSGFLRSIMVGMPGH
jgi:hypothetical protein